MIRCTQCNSALEPWELVEGRCPFCFPRQIKRSRPMTKLETEVVLDAGCPNCKGLPWTYSMGVAYCKECGNVPPTSVPIHNQRRTVKFNIFFNLLGLEWPFDIEITQRNTNLVAEAIANSNGSKILAIKTLRLYWPEYLDLKEAKDMIDAAW